MKPRWKDAPEWANYLAQDDNGRWYWYERRPRVFGSQWFAPYPSQFSIAGREVRNFQESLEKRP